MTKANLARRRAEAQRRVADEWKALEEKCSRVLPSRADALESLLIERGIVTEGEIEKKLAELRLVNV